jgi:hypothetical protein
MSKKDKKSREDKPKAEPEQLGETAIGQPEEVPQPEQQEQETTAPEDAGETVPSEPPAEGPAAAEPPDIEGPAPEREPSAAELLKHLPEMANEIREALKDGMVAAVERCEEIYLAILATMHLEPEHVLSVRVLDDGRVRFVTRGGRKLTFPDDVERARKLTQAEKDGQWPGGKPANVKSWNEPKEESKE